jgi:diacylglycerol kinase family enzyme
MPRVAGYDSPSADSVQVVRALLVVNPHATSTTPAGLNVLAAALSSEVKLDVAMTTHRGHAAELAAQARRDRFDLVVVHGGDGTANEVVNGLLMTGDGQEGPALAVVPGGSANVFGATLGVSRDPVEATNQLLVALREGRRRSVRLGRVLALDEQRRARWAEPRWFTFNAGLGMDALAVRRVERARARGKRATTARYLGAALLSYFTQDLDHPHLTVELTGEDPISGVYLAIVANSDPYTYAGARAVRMHHGHALDNGLGLFALRTMALFPVLRHCGQVLGRGKPHGRRLVRRHDLPSLAVTSDVPIELQVDGDYVGRHVGAQFESIPDALVVVA